MKQWFFALLAVLCFSCDDIIEVANISNRTVTVLAPTDNSVLTLTDINFSWNSIEDAEQYRLQIATPSFEMANQIVLDTIITDTNFTHTLTSGSFQWRVRAENSGLKPLIPLKVLLLKTKNKTYILLAAVLGIWGTVGYKIINGLNSDELVASEEIQNVKFTPKTIAEADTFFIHDVDRDPFLGTLAKKKTNNNTKSSIKVVQPQTPSIAISYGGMIKKQKTKDQVFVVNINNKQYLLKKGQVVDSVKLVRGNAKEIIINYNKKSQTIKRQ